MTDPSKPLASLPGASTQYRDVRKTSNLITKLIRSDAIGQLSKMLIQEELDVDSPDDNRNRPILLAATTNNQRVVKLLVEYGARTDVVDANDKPILYHTIYLGLDSITRYLIGMNSKTVGVPLVNLIDGDGSTPIFYATNLQSVTILRLLLSNGANPDYKNRDGQAVLHLAASIGWTEGVHILLESGGDPDIIGSYGMTPLHYAAKGGHLGAITTLLKMGASTFAIEDRYRLQPIFYPILESKNDYNIVQAFLQHGIDPNHQDYQGNTILHYAVLQRHIRAIIGILDRYPVAIRSSTEWYAHKDREHTNPGLINQRGETPLHILLGQCTFSPSANPAHVQKNLPPYWRTLIAATKLSVQDNSGITPLHRIARHGLWKAYSSAMEKKKLYAFIPDRHGETPDQLIAQADRSDWTDLLVKSYLNQLTRYPGRWQNPIDNKCSNPELPDLEIAKCKKEIMERIRSEHVSRPLKKGIQLIDAPREYRTTFYVSRLDMGSCLRYLLDLFPSDLQIVLNKDAPRVADDIPSLEVIWEDQRLSMPPGIADAVSDQYPAVGVPRWLLIPFNIYIGEQEYAHYNNLILDRKTMTMERFDSHGSGYPTEMNYNPDLLDEVLQKKMRGFLEGGKCATMAASFRYLAPKQFIPAIGFQVFDAESESDYSNSDPDGYCMLWGTWYLEHRIKNPEVPPDSLIRKLMRAVRLSKFSFRSTIRNYSNNITAVRDRILADADANLYQYQNNMLTEQQLAIITNRVFVGWSA